MPSGPRIILYIGMGAIGGTIFVGTAYWTAISYAPAPTYTVSDVDRERTWEKIAPTYFNDTKGQEFYLGIRNLRKKLAKECRGDVLEVGAGTGTMVGLYPAFEEKVDDQVLTSRAAEGKAHKKAEGTDIVSTVLDKALVNQKLDGERQYSSSSSSSPLTATTNSSLRKNKNIAGVRQVIMGDRAVNMLKELEEKIQSHLGFKPHRIDEDEARNWVPGTMKINEEPASANGHEVSPSSVIIKTKAGTTFDPEVISPVTGVKHPLVKTSTGEKHPLYQTANFSAENIPFPDNSFDTVVDIFGLCSYDDPVKALMEMSRVCKPDGEIILLEHGKGTWSKINMQLDKWAPRHAKTWGCWWNRDHRRYLRLAGLKVTSKEIKHFGTTMKMNVKPNKNWMPEWKHIEAGSS